MSGPFNAPERRRMATINMTPLIDVMFLLLIFFMVSSTFREDYVIDITLPRAESATNQEIDSHEIVVDRHGVVHFLGQAVSPEQLREALGKVLAEDEGATIVLRADNEADFGRVLRVIDVARDLKAANLIIPTDLLGESPGSP